MTESAHVQKAKITCWIVKKIFRAKGNLYKIWDASESFVESFVDSLPEVEIVHFESKYRSIAWLSFFFFFLKLFKHNYFFRKGKIYWRTEPSFLGLQAFMKRAYKQ